MSLTQALKARLSSWQSSPSAPLRALARAVRALGSLRRFVLNPRIRSEQLTRLRHPGRHLQGATFTAPNRYPELFEACRRQLAPLASPVILSFGCATGDEVFTLATYLPHATIVGVDINPWCLRQCRARNPDPRLHFFSSLDPAFHALGPFDAIFCMAVFQRTEHRLNAPAVIQRGFTFGRFQGEITQLDALLKPGGLFFIDHADFRFEDTSTARHYSRLDFPGNEALADRPVFGPDNTLVATRYLVHRAFLKQAPPEPPAAT